MNRAARISLVTGFFVLVGLGLLLQPDSRDMTRSSFGRVPEGFGALYDWLHALSLPVARSYAAADQLPATQTVWWIDPHVDCDGASLSAWISAGGTAVLMPRANADGCDLAADLELPAILVQEAPPTPNGDAPDASVTGALVPQPRALVCGKLATFSSSEGWEALALLDGRPFVLERRLGEGRLVLVADARFLENRCLGEADAAPLAADLVRRFGRPWLDERSHGLRAPHGTLSTLARSPALPFFLGVALLGGLYVWRGAAVPPRRLVEPWLPAPTLEAFVASLASLYAGTRDHARVLERYRELTLSRLRRSFGLAPGTTAEQIRERLERRAGLPAAGLDALASTRRIQRRDELEREVAALDALVYAATR